MIAIEIEIEKEIGVNIDRCRYRYKKIMWNWLTRSWRLKVPRSRVGMWRPRRTDGISLSIQV